MASDSDGDDKKSSVRGHLWDFVTQNPGESVVGVVIILAIAGNVGDLFLSAQFRAEMKAKIDTFVTDEDLDVHSGQAHAGAVSETEFQLTNLRLTNMESILEDVKEMMASSRSNSVEIDRIQRSESDLSIRVRKLENDVLLLKGREVGAVIQENTVSILPADSAYKTWREATQPHRVQIPGKTFYVRD